MKTLAIISILSCSLGAVAQTTSSVSSGNGSTSSVTTSATGNQQTVSVSSPSLSASNSQSITFMGPSETNSTINSTSNINTNGTQNINTSGTTTQNINSSGTTTQNINTNASGTARNIVEYTGSYTVKNVPSVSGPNLSTSNDTCMGSSSGSANGTGFGIGFGTTWTDEHCKRLKMSRELWNKGMKAASLAMDCMDEAARMALEITGTKCPQSMTVEERRAAFGPQASAAGAVSSHPGAEALASSSAPVRTLDSQAAAQYAK